MANANPTTQVNDGPDNNIPPNKYELLEHCRALAFAITELNNSMVRDTLHWILVERLNALHDLMEQEV